MENFDTWNGKKKQIENSTVELDCFPYEKEVWMCSLGKNLGSEQNGSGETFSRPVLIVKKFNNQIFWVVPLSTKQKGFDFYYNFSDQNSQNISVVLAQLRLVSIKRFNRNLYKMPQEHFDAVRTRLKGFLS